jgi:hypothetical protein
MSHDPAALARTMNPDCALCHHYESDHDPFSRGCMGLDHTTGAVCDCPCFEPEPCGCGRPHDCPDCQDTH